MKKVAWMAAAVLVAAWGAAPSTALAAACGTITDVGCCGMGFARYCEAGQLKELDCTKNGPADETVCGWVEDIGSGVYDCGGRGKDPGGIYPYLCPGAVCTPSCAGKDCGSDGCDGYCGKEPGGACPSPRICSQAFLCDQLPACDGIPREGCCDLNVSKWCEKGYLHVVECKDTTCGWNGNEAGVGVYDCNKTAEDPSGTYPKDCAFYVPATEPTGDFASVSDAAVTPDVPAAGDLPGTDKGAAVPDGAIVIDVPVDSGRDAGTGGVVVQKGSSCGQSLAPVGSPWALAAMFLALGVAAAWRRNAR